MTKQVEGQMSLFDLDIWCGKTFQAHSVQTKEKTSDVSSKRPQESSVKMPLFLNLQKESGLLAVVLWETDGASLGEYTTHSFGESPKDVRESRLSQILEDRPHPKYSLSAKACQGILNRANRRGKTLPKQLEEALIAQSVSKNAPDVRGGAKESSFSMSGQEHYPPKTINQSCNWDGTQISPTLTSHNADGGQRMPDKENFNAVICVESEKSVTTYRKQGHPQNSEQAQGWEHTDVNDTLNAFDTGEIRTPTLVVEDHSEETMCVVQDAYDKLTESQISASIKASGGNYGGGAKHL